MFKSQQWSECVIQPSGGRLTNIKFWCDTGPHFRCYELVQYLKSENTLSLPIELHFHAEHHGKCLTDSWFSLVSRALKQHSLRPGSQQLSVGDLKDALYTVLGEFRANKRARTNNQEDSTWNFCLLDYIREASERPTLNPKTGFINSVYYISIPADKQSVSFRLPGEELDRLVELGETKSKAPSASLQGFANPVPSAVRSPESSVRNPLASQAGRLQRAENIRSGNAQQKKSSGVARRTYLCSKCGEPKRGHTCSAASTSPEVPESQTTNQQLSRSSSSAPVTQPSTQHSQQSSVQLSPQGEPHSSAEHVTASGAQQGKSRKNKKRDSVVANNTTLTSNQSSTTATAASPTQAQQQRSKKRACRAPAADQATSEGGLRNFFASALTSLWSSKTTDCARDTSALGREVVRQRRRGAERLAV